jgi:lipoyl-dependent peroxiredoxin
MAITPIEKILYTAKTHTTGGREGGHSRTSDGNLDVRLGVPGTDQPGTNPEQLFAVGWSSCYFSALKLVAAQKKIRLSPDSSVDTEVDLGTTNNAYFIQARLNINLPGVDRSTAQELAAEAHKTCPYSKATHGNINVVTNIVDSQSATQVA